MIELSYPGDLTDPDALAMQLSATGLNIEACVSKARLFAKAVAMLSVTGDAARNVSPLAFFVPGRVEVLGKHTDYAGGRSLVAAIEQGFSMVAFARNDSQMIVIDARNGQTLRYVIGDEGPIPSHSWAAFPMEVTRRMAKDFPGACRGANIAMLSDLPPNAGLGSSMALMVGVFSVLSEINQLPARDEYWHNIGNKNELASYLGAIKAAKRFGKLKGDSDRSSFGGGEDAVGILCTESNNLSQYAYCPVEFERFLPMPHGYVFAIGVSGVVPGSDPESEARRAMPERLAAELLKLWRRETGRDDQHLAAALGSSPDAVERWKSWIATADVGDFDRDALAARLDHFILESGEIIPEFHDALAANDWQAVGDLIDRSQRAAEEWLGNQTPETTALVASARRAGAVASSSFGKGFGGSVWALVEASRADDMLTAWADEYRFEFAEHTQTSKFFLTVAGPAAFRVC
jgi:galactokinase